MFFLTFLYALFTAAGILGIGAWAWRLLRRETVPQINTAALAFTPNPFLSAGIMWLLGYTLYEGLLTTLSVIHLFQPVTVLAAGTLLTLAGLRNLWRCRPSVPDIALWEYLALGAISAFLLFWSLYPAFDVDRMSFYFVSIRQMLEQGGRTFSPFADIRLAVSQGENLINALGFAWQPHSTLFPQLMHGISKVFLVLAVYGGARAIGGGTLSLLAPVFIISEEHLIASGANGFVYINMLFAIGIFLAFYGFYVFKEYRRYDYLFISLIGIAAAVTAKYLALYFAALFALFFTGIFLFTPEKRPSWLKKFLLRPRSVALLAASVTAMLLPFLYNWIVTGTPFFPASMGPFHSPYYDNAVNEIARTYHYHLSVGDAIKNALAFMVWPGILPAKILPPLAIMAALVALLTKNNDQRLLKNSAAFFLFSILATMATAVYMVFEMRYYRFGIGLYALSATLFINYLFNSLIGISTTLRRWHKTATIIILCVTCAYGIKYSFSVMGSTRPTPQEIVRFVAGKETETAIMMKRYPKAHALYDGLKASEVPGDKLGFFSSFSWPQAIYPLPGKNIGFLNAAAFESYVYFDQGSLAAALKRSNIRYIFNQIVNDENYPLAGGEVYQLLKDCGEPLISGKNEWLSLRDACLDEKIVRKNPEEGQRKLAWAMEKVRSYPAYNPFNPPTYGGPMGVIK
jgi:hypothetical protein